MPGGKMHLAGLVAIASVLVFAFVARNLPTHGGSTANAPTLGERLDGVRGKPSGFDYLRIALALSVAITHIPGLTFGETSHQGWVYTTLDRLHLWTPVYAILPMFFALSGFLIARSLERCRTVVAFLGLRMIRLVPALTVVVLISALVLGPLLTELALRDYFSDELFSKYFLNIFSAIQYDLPGLFTDNPDRGIVNGQFWTIPVEVLCYVSIAALAALGVRRFRALAPIFTLGTIAAFVLYHGTRYGWQHAPDFSVAGVKRGLFLIWSFLCGMTLYYYRDRIRWNGFLCLAAATAAYLSLLLRGHFAYLLPPSIAYVTVFLGLANPKRLWVLRGADYSYGLFISHWAIMQTVMHFAPRNEFATVFIGLPLSLGAAALSWNLVERPCRKLRRFVMEADAGRAPRAPLLVSGAAALVIAPAAVAYEGWLALAN
jgi:peptidoglycan/LPS O-acetylase OafA/YrhL